MMGFPVGYTELFFPKLLIKVLTFLGLVRELIIVIFRLIRLIEFSEPEFLTDSFTQFPSVTAVLLRELLPVVKFSELIDPPDSCAVCLYEFDAGDEIRRLTNCRHIFHRSCLDKWMDCDQTTCPLCRTPFISEDLQDSFNDQLRSTSGIVDYYDESPVVIC